MVSNVIAGPLESRVAIVTGAATGIGRACAELLAERGAKTAVVDINSKGAEQVAEAIRQQGGIVYYRCSVSSGWRHAPDRGAPLRGPLGKSADC